MIICLTMLPKATSAADASATAGAAIQRCLHFHSTLGTELG